MKFLSLLIFLLFYYISLSANLEFVKYKILDKQGNIVYPVTGMGKQFADINGDGYCDILYIKQTRLDTPKGLKYLYEVDIAFQNSKGTFKPKVNIYTSNKEFTSVNFFRDMNGDGKIDMVFGSFYQVFYIAYQIDSVHFDIINYNISPINVTSFAFGDMDGDGKEDIVYRPGGVDSVLCFLYARDSLKYEFKQKSFPNIGRYIGLPKLADVNKDGKLDIIRLIDYSLEGKYDVYINLQLDSGKIDNSIVYPYSNVRNTSFNMFDINHDGLLDMVSLMVGSGKQIMAYKLQQPGGMFSATVTNSMLLGPELIDFGYMEINSLLCDGNLNLIINDVLSHKTYIYNQKSDNTWELSNYFPDLSSALQTSYQTIDFDNDKRKDFVMWERSGVATLYRNQTKTNSYSSTGDTIIETLINRDSSYYGFENENWDDKKKFEVIGRDTLFEYDFVNYNTGIVTSYYRINNKGYEISLYKNILIRDSFHIVIDTMCSNAIYNFEKYGRDTTHVYLPFDSRYFEGIWWKNFTIETRLYGINIEHAKTPLNLIIYPNPVSDILKIEIDNEHKIKDLFLYDYTGKKIELGMDQDYSKLDLSTVVPGNYMLQIVLDEGIVSKKIVIIR